MGDLVTAVKELRSQLGDTQQALANRLGCSLRAVANYEAGRQPTTEVLVTLANQAHLHKFENLERQFSEALSAAMQGRTTPATKEEAAWTRALLLLVRNKKVVPEWTQLATQLDTALDQLLVTACTHETVRTDPHELEKALFEVRSILYPTAEGKLNRLARERSGRTGQSFEKSYSEVLLEHPDLYTEFVHQRESAARTRSLALHGARRPAQRQKPQKRATKARREKK